MSVIEKFNRPFILLDPIKCTLRNGTNTEPVNSSVPFFYGETYTYTCLESYSTEDEVNATCTAKGTLSLSPPHCCKLPAIRSFIKTSVLILIYGIEC